MQIQGVMRKSIPFAGGLFALLLPATIRGQESTGDTDTIAAKTAYALPGGAKITSFDISFVDAFSRVFLLADRTNKSLDGVDLNTGNTAMIVPTGANAFRGFVADPNVMGPNDVSGPNGVATVHHAEAWVTDAPSFSGPIVMNADPKVAYAADNCDSPLYVIDLITQQVTDKINLKGCFRADEVAWDPKDEIFLVANPGEQDIGKAGTPTAAFVTLISTWPVAPGNSHAILATIPFDGTNRTPKATAGIEQAVWSPKTGLFYVALPQNGPDPNNGGVVVIDPAEKKGPRVLGTIPVTNCSPNGAALGPNFELFLGCTAGPVQIIDIRNGNVMATIPQIPGGCDEVTFNAGDNHFAGACNGTVGIVDAKPPILFDQNTGGISHSIASDPVLNLLLAPVPSTAPDVMTLCGTTNGCIAGFGPSGMDDPGSWAPPRENDNGRGRGDDRGDSDN